ncbi:type VI secretion system ATPase TssH [Vibrio vulnificus]|uniref:Type VI secretion system ATPase TssH n=2 Tax=Vibrio vulnificus TaxID=672 RepID=A0A2S3R3A6_VIBVL|nr:type VI secretion system ATPase TssH [Vibrio vulnificus]ELP6755696.1 type VI secretion system ATPase TssH [Vibrio vulnificus]MDK2620483.1 type VI secretion system ATPase TssH [Vibrio vulnificus]POB48172.1 type VI secretion system ATPase TssH [Vibrio vulnificus]RAH30739.1 type VI secretion system ATPase TssH [Vibrio vulnificus]HDY7706884.1 type VI secretion system ATPase TssH [Vibrio vulnificus]
MIRIELPNLIAKLNAQSKFALEQAASLCIERQHPEVTLAHYLDVLLDNPLSDVRLVLKQAGLETDHVKNAIASTYNREQVLDTYPAFSPLLVELLQEAWLLSTTELEQNELRSGAIFLAAIIRADRYLSIKLINLFEVINRENLKKHFVSILRDSSETAVDKHKLNNTASLQAPSETPLGRFCSNVTEQARNGELDPVLSRENELNLMVDILCRRRKNNPIVVGEAGVGKSAMIEGLALRIVAGRVPSRLKNVELYSLDLGRLQAGASVKGEFEKRLKSVIDSIKQSAKPIILFIDEAHTLIGSGNQEGGSDAANLLKPALARGELSTIAATTWKEYKKYFEKDPALTRRFQLVKLDEPTITQAVDILRGLHSVYERAHGVFITDDALKAAAELSARYISGRQLPDKAIDVLDTACARIAINITTPPKRIALLETLCYQRQLEINMLERAQFLGQDIDLERLEKLRNEELSDEIEKAELTEAWEQQKKTVESIIALRLELMELSQSSEQEPEHVQSIRAELHEKHHALEAIAQEQRLMYPQVDSVQIAEVIADWTGVPIDQMNTDELHKITHLTSILGQTIKGQDTAIEKIHQHLLTARADLRRPGRPKGAFLLVGPSGVGKTETVVQLAEQLYGGKQFLTTINMSEYQEKHTVSRLIGSPPGYVGYGEGGVLTEAIRKMPYSVVLLDEVEKAHPEVLNIFYQGFDKGEIADGEGRVIDCQNVVFFLTSNLGFQTIVEHVEEPSKIDDALYPELSAFFKPALLARMEVIPYLPLSKEVLAQIVRSKLTRLENVFRTRYNAKVVIEESLVDEILNRATRSENGARMLEAIIEGQLLPPVSLALLNKLAGREPVERIRLAADEGEFIGEVA